MCFAQTNSQKLSLDYSTTSISPLECEVCLLKVITEQKQYEAKR